MLQVGLDVQLDYRVALFAVVTGLLAGLLSGLIPAIRCSRGELNPLIGRRILALRLANAFRRALVAGQVTVASMGLVISGLSLQSLSLIRKTDPGFRVNNVLTMAFSPTQSLGYTVTQSQQFLSAARRPDSNDARVQSAALSHQSPLGVGA
jgi:hypothetical protein